MHRLAFIVDPMSERGTSVSTFDFADFAEVELGLPPPLILWRNNSSFRESALQVYEKRFGRNRVRQISSFQGGKPDSPLERMLREEKITGLYHQKSGSGSNDGAYSNSPAVRHLPHLVFDGKKQWTHAAHGGGTAAALISRNVPVLPTCKLPVVPLIVRPMPLHGPDLRAELDIPPNAVVFGRHGGRTTFNIKGTRQVVMEVALAHPHIYFVFMNTAGYDKLNQSNIKHVAQTSDRERKAAFIRTCDAMLHARQQGETFGLSVAEFSVMNKPVITSPPTAFKRSSKSSDTQGKATAHIQILGNRALVYRSGAQLRDYLVKFDREAMAKRDWNAYRSYQPAQVMRAFRCVFLGRGERECPAYAFDQHEVATITLVDTSCTCARTTNASWTPQPSK